MGSTSKNEETPGKHGLYDLSGLDLSLHARERLAERFPELDLSEEKVRTSLKACRRLGTNPNRAVAYIMLIEESLVFLIVMDGVILTALNEEQFTKVMTDFGRFRWPRKTGRWFRRIRDAVTELETKEFREES